MNKIFCILLIINISFLYSQNSDNFIIVSIEKTTSKGIHKQETDYWIISLSEWKEIDKRAIYPYLPNGFNLSDLKECCTNKELLFFYYTKEEEEALDIDYLTKIESLENIIQQNRKKVQVIRKKWSTKKRQKINIYLTPVKGDFCFCNMKHSNPKVELEYKGLISLPLSNFSYDKNFWKSELSVHIQSYDYSDLPFLSLYNLR